MCQLSLINTSTNRLTNNLFGYLMNINSMNNNPHGWGYFSPKNGIYKSNLMPHQDDNFYNLIPKLKPDTILGHVRLASVKNGEIKQEDAHPFDKTNIVLAHNGTLSRIHGTSPIGIIDSEDFANELDKEYGKTKNMLESLKTVYNNLFAGKFAFLIYSKIEKAYYVARGTTANLWKINVVLTTKKDERVEFMLINTEKDSALQTLDTFYNVMCLNGDLKDIEWSSEILKANTIYKLGEHALHELGNLVQREKPYYSNNYNNNYKNTTKTTSSNIVKSKSEAFKLGKLLANKGLTIEEVVAYAYFLSGSGPNTLLFGCDYTEVNKGLDAFHTGAKQKAWQASIAYYYGKELSIYTDFDLYFPYYFNSIEKINEVKEKVQNSGLHTIL